MSANITIDAVYDNGVLRPIQPLTLKQDEHVTITVHGATVTEWPSDAAEIYKELEVEDRKLASEMWPTNSEKTR